MKTNYEYIVKDVYIRDILKVFDHINNSPEMDMKLEYMKKYLSGITLTHKRILYLYFTQLFSQSTNQMFFQQFIQDNQEEYVQISLLDLKIVSEQTVYTRDYFYKVEEFMSKLPEPIYRFCSAYFSKTNISGLSLSTLKELYEEYKIEDGEIDMTDIDISHFSLKEKKFKGTRLFTMKNIKVNNYPIVVTTIKSELLYYFKHNGGITTNLLDKKLLSKLENVFDGNVYMLGAYDGEMFDLIYLSRLQLQLNEKDIIKGLYVQELQFEQELLDNLSLIMEYKVCDFRVVRSLKQLISYTLREYKSCIMLRPHSVDVFDTRSYIRRVNVQGFIDGTIVVFKDYVSKSEFEVSAKDFEEHNESVEFKDLRYGETYYVVLRDKNKYIIVSDEDVSARSKDAGAMKKVKISGKGIKAFD